MNTDPPAGAAHDAPCRVLIVDDNRDAADSMAILLQVAGAATRAVYDGAAALAVAREFRPDLVLLDIGLPGMDGYEVARALRDDAAFRDVMLVALTGWDLGDEPERMRAAGFDRHLVKPAESTTLITLVHEAGQPPADRLPRTI